MRKNNIVLKFVQNSKLLNIFKFKEEADRDSDKFLK